MVDRRVLLQSLLKDCAVAMAYSAGLVIWCFVGMAIGAITILGGVVRMNPKLQSWWAVRSIRASLLRAAALLGADEAGTPAPPGAVDAVSEPVARGRRR